MTIRDISAASLALALAAAPGAARAHDLACDQSAGGLTAIVVRHYPAKIHFSVTVRNVHPTDASTVASVRAPLLERLGFHFTPAAPFTLPVGGQVVNAFDVVVKSRATCEALAAGGMPPPAPYPGATPAAYGERCAGHGHGQGGDDGACEEERDGDGDHDGDHHVGHGDGDHHGDDGSDHHEGDGDGHHGDGDGDHHGACTSGLCAPGAFLDSVFVAAFDLGAAECRARIVCGGDDGEEGEPGDDDGRHGGDDHGRGGDDRGDGGGGGGHDAGHGAGGTYGH